MWGGWNAISLGCPGTANTMWPGCRLLCELVTWGWMCTGVGKLVVERAVGLCLLSSVREEQLLHGRSRPRCGRRGYRADGGQPHQPRRRQRGRRSLFCSGTAPPSKMCRLQCSNININIIHMVSCIVVGLGWGAG